jgi:tetratricopeptide (TPR) repeat protein
MMAPLNRRTVLGIMIAGLVPAFALTYAIVGRYRGQRQDLASEWNARGERDINRSPDVAVGDFETALVYGPERTGTRLRLAQALIAAGRSFEAKTRLLTLRAEEPGNGLLNLELARLAAADHELGDAVRDYHAAIDGSWETGGASARRGARLELAKLLLSNGQPLRAQAELIALIDDLPADAALLTEVGQMLIQADGDGDAALKLFQRALAVDPAYARAARAAGDVAFRAGDYRMAQRYLTTAAAHAPLAPDDQNKLSVSLRVPALDPLARGLSARGRAQRAQRLLALADLRLSRCEDRPSPSPDVTARLSALREQVQAQANMRERDLERDPDLFDQTMALVGEITRLPSTACGSDTVDDRVLSIVAGQRPSPTT